MVLLGCKRVKGLGYRGVAKIFQRGVTRCQNEVTHQIFMSFLPTVVGCFKGGVTRCQNEVTHHIFMSFLPPVVACLLKHGLQRGGHRLPRTPLATPLGY